MPLFKGKGSAENPDNYRGIALTSCAYKVLTSLSTKRPADRMEEELPPEQYGLLRHGSATDALNSVIEYIKEKRPEMTYAVSIDYKKCFDPVPRNLLLRTLGEFRIHSNLRRLLANISQPNYIKVREGDHVVDREIRQNHGLTRGDLARPFLFVLYASKSADIPGRTGAKLALFADDLVIPAKDRQRLQSYIRRAIEWSDEYGVDINTEKAKVIRFSNGGSYATDDRRI
ncbi:uncharacterized protein LOC108864156 [Galendromus occidentalis]|uniref:Uncharacterized protein LOC108864156 n=1 Tax=Galendromus occidentalis TaxID=34638 RepID=A0AAJ7L5G3_9ACAR|nr:uncharacterized protein LOC108864156 [Galendromus occidentalis]